MIEINVCMVKIPEKPHTTMPYHQYLMSIINVVASLCSPIRTPTGPGTGERVAVKSSTPSSTLSCWMGTSTSFTVSSAPNVTSRDTAV